ncbi:MAG TPA: hypothetical protein VLZ10_04675 [Thermodesulfobacteriota bacterium]|nr:hypothetical protein [Thermodesulfobacteriota bacterium]
MKKIMNESIDQKSAVASTVKDPEVGIPMGVRCVLLFAVLVFANLSAIAFAQSSSCPGIHVKVERQVALVSSIGKNRLNTAFLVKK